MEPSHVLPLRPVPKIQTMFSGLTPHGSPARDGRWASERRDLPLVTARRQAHLNLGVNIVPPTPSGGLVGHKVIATIYSHKPHLHAASHYTLTRSSLSGATLPGLGADRHETRAFLARWVTKPLATRRPCKIMWPCRAVESSCRGTFVDERVPSARVPAVTIYTSSEPHGTPGVLKDSNSVVRCS